MLFIVTKSTVTPNGKLFMQSLGTFPEKENAYKCIETDISSKEFRIFPKKYKVLRTNDAFVYSNTNLNKIVGYQIVTI